MLQTHKNSRVQALSGNAGHGVYASMPWTMPLAVLGAAAVLAALFLASIHHAHSLDYTLLHWVNRLSGRSFALDDLIGDLTLPMFSSVLLVALVWYVYGAAEGLDERACIVMGALTAFASGILSRCLQLALPVHLRPLHDPALGFRVPHGVDPTSLNHWSSFPSDHAAVFFGLAAVVLMAKPRLGYGALLLALLFNAARLYQGLHYPSDILAGALLGILAVTVAARFAPPAFLRRWTSPYGPDHAAFQGVWFYLCFGIATLFNEYRDVASETAGLLHLHLRHHH